MTCKKKSPRIGYEKAINDSLSKIEHILNDFCENCEEWGTNQDGDCRGKSCADCVLKHAIEAIKGQLIEFQREFLFCVIM